MKKAIKFCTPQSKNVKLYFHYNGIPAYYDESSLSYIQCQQIKHKQNKKKTWIKIVSKKAKAQNLLLKKMKELAISKTYRKPRYGKILIIGGSGLLGYNLAQMASEKWKTFATFHNHPFSLLGCETLPLDLCCKCDITRIISEIQPRVIINAAGITNPDFCTEHKELAHLVNVIGTEILAETARKYNIRLIHLSSDLVFDGTQGMYEIDDQPRPLNYYAGTKLSGERIILNKVKNSAVVRTSIIYGWGNEFASSFVERMLKQLEKGNILNLFIDQYRTPVWVMDLCALLLELAERDDSRGIFHAGSPRKYNRYEFGLKLAKIFNLDNSLMRPISIHDIDWKAIRSEDCSLSVKKTQAKVSVRFLDIIEGLEQMLEERDEWLE